MGEPVTRKWTRLEHERLVETKILGPEARIELPEAIDRPRADRAAVRTPPRRLELAVVGPHPEPAVPAGHHRKVCVGPVRLVIRVVLSKLHRNKGNER